MKKRSLALLATALLSGCKLSSNNYATPGYWREMTYNELLDSQTKRLGYASFDSMLKKLDEESNDKKVVARTSVTLFGGLFDASQFSSQPNIEFKSFKDCGRYIRGIYPAARAGSSVNIQCVRPENGASFAIDTAYFIWNEEFPDDNKRNKIWQPTPK